MNAPLPRPEADEAALVELLSVLEAENYAFVTPSPDTHAFVLDREPGRIARDLRDIFGWSRPFAPGAFPEIEALLAWTGLLTPAPQGLRSEVRVSTLDGRLFLHSAYPTQTEDAVFLGPDSYRFARFIHAHVPPSWGPQESSTSAAARASGPSRRRPCCPGPRPWPGTSMRRRSASRPPMRCTRACR